MSQTEVLLREAGLTLERKPTTEINPYKFQLRHHKFTSECKVQIWEVGDRAFIMFTELDKNPGVSVTNAANFLVQEVYNKYLGGRIKKENCLFAEIYQSQDMISVILPDWNDDECYRVEFGYMGKLIKPEKIQD